MVASTYSTAYSFFQEPLAGKPHSFAEIYRRLAEAQDLPQVLTAHQRYLQSTDPVLFSYLDDEKQRHWRKAQIIAALLALATLECELVNRKTENKEDYLAFTKEILDRYEAAGLAAVDFLSEKYEALRAHGQLPTRRTKQIKQIIEPINAYRLYWIWASVLLKTIFDLLPQVFHRCQQAIEEIKFPDPYTGFLSWGLYGFRFLVNFSLLLSHCFALFGLTPEERNHRSWQTLFKEQWAQRKFTLLNDFLWGVANVLCYFWLTGTGTLNAWGDVVTIALLVFDLAASIWEFVELKGQYKKNVQQLRDLLAHAEDQLQRQVLQQALNSLESEWQFQKYDLYNNMAYSLALLFAYILLSMPFMPIPAVAAMPILVTGAVLCFVFTFINNALKNGIVVAQARADLNQAREILRTLSEIKSPAHYLERLKAERHYVYQQQNHRYQWANLVRSMTIEAAAPLIIFSGLIFLPTAACLGVFAGALGLALLSKLLIEVLFKPQEQLSALPDFNQEKYQTYEGQTLGPKPGLLKAQGFFARISPSALVADLSFSPKPA